MRHATTRYDPKACSNAGNCAKLVFFDHASILEHVEQNVDFPTGAVLVDQFAVRSAGPTRQRRHCSNGRRSLTKANCNPMTTIAQRMATQSTTRRSQFKARYQAAPAPNAAMARTSSASTGVVPARIMVASTAGTATAR